MSTNAYQRNSDGLLYDSFGYFGYHYANAVNPIYYQRPALSKIDD